MKALLIALLFPLFLMADYKDVVYLKNTTLWGEGSSQYIHESGRLNRTAVEYVSLYKNENGFALDLDIEAFHHANDYGKFKNSSLEYEKKNEIQYNSVMASYSYEDFSVYAGLIPFRGGHFAEIKDVQYAEHAGNGLELLINQVFVGAFLSYRYDDCWTFIIGKAKWEKWYNYNSLGAQNDHSDGIFSILKYSDGQHYLEFNYYDVNAILNADTDYPVDYGKMRLGGVGYIYDDSFDSGFTYYAEAGFSHMHERVPELIDSTFAENPGVIPFLPLLGYEVNPQTNTGYAAKAGMKYDDEIFDKEYYVGFEYFKTWKHWVSMNHGTVFLSNHSWWQNKVANQWMVFGGFHITPELSFNANYSRAKSKHAPKYFSISSSVPLSSVPDDQKENFFTDVERIQFSVVYAF